MTDTLRDKLIQKGWVTEFNANTLVRLIEEHYAELAKPAAVTGQPSDEELTQHLFEGFRGPIEFLCDAEEDAHLMIRSHVKFARAVLAHWGNPAPAPLADGDVAELVEDLREQANHGYCEFISRDDLRRAAELLQRQALVPVAAAKPRKCLIEPPSWCDDGQAHAWQAGWEARDEMLLQPWPPGVGK